MAISSSALEGSRRTSNSGGQEAKGCRLAVLVDGSRTGNGAPQRLVQLHHPSACSAASWRFWRGRPARRRSQKAKRPLGLWLAEKQFTASSHGARYKLFSLFWLCTVTSRLWGRWKDFIRKAIGRSQPLFGVPLLWREFWFDIHRKACLIPLVQQSTIKWPQLNACTRVIFNVRLCYKPYIRPVLNKKKNIKKEKGSFYTTVTQDTVWLQILESFQRKCKEGLLFRTINDYWYCIVTYTFSLISLLLIWVWVSEFWSVCQCDGTYYA